MTKTPRFCNTQYRAGDPILPSMRPENQLDPGHNEKRGILRVIGPVIFIVGLIFMIVGLVSFFIAFGGHGFPRLFWCCFVGLPLLWLGSVLSGAGFIGAAARYLAGESAPVAKDTFNYMADGTKEGVKHSGDGGWRAAWRPAAGSANRCNSAATNATRLTMPIPSFGKECGHSFEEQSLSRVQRIERSRREVLR